MTLKTPANSRTFTGMLTWSGMMVSSGYATTIGDMYKLSPYPCEACGNDIENGDHVSIQIGEEENVYFHKSCYIDSDNQAMIRSLVVAEDVMGI